MRMSITEALAVMGLQVCIVLVLPPVVGIVAAKMKSWGRLSRERLAWLGVAAMLILWLALQVAPGMYPWGLTFWRRILTTAPIYLRCWGAGPNLVMVRVIVFLLLPSILGYWWFKMNRIATGERSRWKERALGTFVLAALFIVPLLISPKFATQMHNFAFDPAVRFHWPIILLWVSLCIILLSFYIRFWQWIGVHFLSMKTKNTDNNMAGADHTVL